MTVTEPTPSVTGPTPTALDQTSLPIEELLHSANAGMIIHRTGQLAYEFSTEGRQWSVDLLDHINKAQLGVCTTFCYEEVFGTRDRLHWLIQMKAPNDYSKLLDMVEHDDKYLDIATNEDRLPEAKGGGNWERMFTYGSLQERIMLGQHGLIHEDHSHEDTGTFVPPAGAQLSQPAELQLNSANAGAIVMRSAEVLYEFREEGRQFAFNWQGHVNRELAGRVTSLLYEETFGQQDRIHWLIHLRTLEDYRALAEFDRSSRTAEEVYGAERLHPSKGGGKWDRLFRPASIKDTLLIPHQRTTPLR
ncbi:DUF6039 family protein [Streptomyces sp. NPDC057486]|uniref:DUF6039 family protein n=1 Tax=Streptomyces sp. NPDC057486 TaxID=3346145 RepID=UPI003687703E